MTELPSLEIHPDLVRRILVDFLRTEITRAGFEPRRRGPFGRRRFGARLLPGGRSPRPGERPGRAHALPDLIPRLARARRPGHRPDRRGRADRAHHAHGRAVPGRHPRRPGRAARQRVRPAAHDRALRPFGRASAAWWSGPATRPRSCSATPRSSAIRPAPSIRSAICTRHRSGSWRAPSVSRRSLSPSRRAPICGPGRRTRGSWDSPTNASTSCCCSWSTAAAFP